LRLASPDLERIEKVKGKTLIANRMPILEQGELTGAVLTCQDPISIQRVDRHIRSRIQPHPEAQRYELTQLLGASQAMSQVRDLAKRYAASSSTVLLLGESGTGKELIAQGIHMASDRRDMPFVAVNCAAVSENLLESELFGYEEGAFTGARRGGKVGLFEAAHKGTIFLDEIGDLPLSLQTRLLRVLQEREVLRVGATEATPIQVRVIAATHRDLMALVQQGQFRLDLYYRINILRLQVPPLRDRLEDLPDLIQALFRKVCAAQGVPIGQAQPVMQALAQHAGSHNWPGNVRELENVVERLVACAAGQPWRESVVSPEDALRQWAPELFEGSRGGMPDRAGIKSAESPVHQDDRAQLLAVLAQCEGDKTRASVALGISRTTLWRKLKQLQRA
jgi:propionate catabolism operon transcriptional regulator